MVALITLFTLDALFALVALITLFALDALFTLVALVTLFALLAVLAVGYGKNRGGAIGVGDGVDVYQTVGRGLLNRNDCTDYQRLRGYTQAVCTGNNTNVCAGKIVRKHCRGFTLKCHHTIIGIVINAKGYLFNRIVNLKTACINHVDAVLRCCKNCLFVGINIFYIITYVVFGLPNADFFKVARRNNSDGLTCFESDINVVSICATQVFQGAVPTVVGIVPRSLFLCKKQLGIRCDFVSVFGDLIPLIALLTRSFIELDGGICHGGLLCDNVSILENVAFEYVTVCILKGAQIPCTEFGILKSCKGFALYGSFGGLTDKDARINGGVIHLCGRCKHKRACGRERISHDKQNTVHTCSGNLALVIGCVIQLNINLFVILTGNYECAADGYREQNSNTLVFFCLKHCKVISTVCKSRLHCHLRRNTLPTKTFNVVKGDLRAFQKDSIRIGNFGAKIYGVPLILAVGVICHLNTGSCGVGLLYKAVFIIDNGRLQQNVPIFCIADFANVRLVDCGILHYGLGFALQQSFHHSDIINTNCGNIQRVAQFNVHFVPAFLLCSKEYCLTCCKTIPLCILVIFNIFVKPNRGSNNVTVVSESNGLTCLQVNFYITTPTIRVGKNNPSATFFITEVVSVFLFVGVHNKLAIAAKFITVSDFYLVPLILCAGFIFKLNKGLLGGFDRRGFFKNKGEVNVIINEIRFLTVFHNGFNIIAVAIYEVLQAVCSFVFKQNIFFVDTDVPNVRSNLIIVSGFDQSVVLFGRSLQKLEFVFQIDDGILCNQKVPIVFVAVFIKIEIQKSIRLFKHLVIENCELIVFGINGENNILATKNSIYKGNGVALFGSLANGE